MSEKILKIWNQLKKTRWILKKKLARFPGSAVYWENRYVEKGDSGAGSYGKLSQFKAETVNGFIDEMNVETVIEFGCGDGNQLKLARYPGYLGFDVSKTAIMLCKEIFVFDETKAFRHMDAYNGEKAELALSLDVIFHLVEDDVFESYMTTLFGAAERYVIIYSSNTENNRGNQEKQIRHRRFSTWIESTQPTWQLIEHIPNKYPIEGEDNGGSFSDF